MLIHRRRANGLGVSMAAMGLRLVVQWPNGTKLPVRLPAAATGADLMNLLQFSCRQDQLFILVLDGNCINPRRELSRQRVHQDCTIDVVMIPDGLSYFVSSDDEVDEQEITSESFDSIYREIMRLTDVQFNLLECHRKGGLIYSQFLDESETEETSDEPHVTVCASPLTEIPKDPLPLCIDTDDPVPDVGRIDPAGSDPNPPGLVDTEMVRHNWIW